MPYQFRIPAQLNRYETGSFGIEPYRVDERDGHRVKAGAALVRIVIYWAVPESVPSAQSIAQAITDRLNSPFFGEYKGPKVIHARPEVLARIPSFFDTTT